MTLPGMTDCTDFPELQAIIALAQCRFYPGTSAKRFVADLHRQCVGKGLRRKLTPNQHKFLWTLVWQYRNQIENRPLVQQAVNVLGDLEGHKNLLLLVEECSLQAAENTGTLPV